MSKRDDRFADFYHLLHVKARELGYRDFFELFYSVVGSGKTDNPGISRLPMATWGALTVLINGKRDSYTPQSRE